MIYLLLPTCGCASVLHGGDVSLNLYLRVQNTRFGGFYLHVEIYWHLMYFKYELRVFGEIINN